MTTKQTVLSSGNSSNYGNVTMKKRKMVTGNTIHEKTAQINLKVTKWGKGPIEAAPEAPAEGEAPAAE